MEKRSSANKRRWTRAASGFDSIASLSPRASTSLTPSSASQSSKRSQSWLVKNVPHSSQDLCVHPKKIEALQQWLMKHAIDKSVSGRVLLLTGPSGSGKTTALHILARELDVELQEWLNPTENTAFDENREEYGKSEGVHYVSNVNHFKNFLLRANRYKQLSTNGGNDSSSPRRLWKHRGGKVVLIEELPSFLSSRTSGQFKEIIAQAKKSQQALVFIDSLNNKLLRELADDELAFNPANQSLMLKMLGKVASNEQIEISRDQLQQIYERAAGDIRVAINLLQLQYSEHSGSVNLPWDGQRAGMKRGRRGKKQASDSKDKKNKQGLQNCQNKDTSLDLFHALGKILYAKRDQPTSETIQREQILRNESLRRPAPLVSDPQRVLENIPVGPEMFTTFLHQNCTDFFSDLNELTMALECFSLSEQFFKEWTGTTRIDLRSYGSYLSASSLSFYNTEVKRQGGMRTFKQPQIYSQRKIIQERNEEVAKLSRIHGVSLVDASLTLTPFILQFHLGKAQGLSRPLIEMATFEVSNGAGYYELCSKTKVESKKNENDTEIHTLNEDEVEEEMFDIEEDFE